MIEIVTGGGLNTVQDLGRYGFRDIGVASAGAMDRLALAAGNLLLGNDAGSAGIEITIVPFRVRFLVATRIVVTGADCALSLDGRSLRPWWSALVREGQVLEVGLARSGSRAYLALAGGLDVPRVLGSRSTDLKAGFGGHEGRALKKGDRLALAAAHTGDPSLKTYGLRPPAQAFAGEFQRDARDVTLRVLPAAEYERFDATAQQQFWDERWQLTPASNRQGFRLAGKALDTQGLRELLSHGIVPGTIQVPPGGLPIVQMCEANTSGGYAKIGCVIEADLWRLAQARVGERLRFVQVDAAGAVRALGVQRDWLRTIEAGAALAGARR